jgi:lipopolysaccharide transport system permease protein
MLKNIANFWNYKELIFVFTKRTLMIRYRQSLLGMWWMVLQPIISAFIFTIIFAKFFTIHTPGDTPYPIFVYCGLIFWTFFNNGVSNSMRSFTDNVSLICRTYFPKEIMPVSSILSGFLDFSISFGILMILMLIFQHPFYIFILLTLPILLILLILMLGLALIFSILNAYSRDTQYSVATLLYFGMFASPVLYDMKNVPISIRNIYYINPLAGIFDNLRRVILYGWSPDYYALGISALISIIILIFGYYFFKRSDKFIADII